MDIDQIPIISKVSQHVHSLAIMGKTPIMASVSISGMVDAHTLLLKQLWIFAQEENELWRMVISSIVEEATRG